MLGAIGALWTLLSLTIAALTTYSFLQPDWFTNEDTLTSLGFFTLCLQVQPRDVATLEGQKRYFESSTDTVSDKGELSSVFGGSTSCGPYGGRFALWTLPSNAWQVSCVLYGGGCVLLVMCALSSLLTLCLPRPHDGRLAHVTGVIQLSAVLLQVAGLLVFPVGLDSSFVRRHCSHSTIYHPGTCHVGWAYLLGIAATAQAFFAPFLSQYTGVTLRHSSPTRKPDSPLIT